MTTKIQPDVKPRISRYREESNSALLGKYIVWSQLRLAVVEALPYWGEERLCCPGLSIYESRRGQ